MKGSVRLGTMLLLSGLLLSGCQMLPNSSLDVKTAGIEQVIIDTNDDISTVLPRDDYQVKPVKSINWLESVDYLTQKMFDMPDTMINEIPLLYVDSIKNKTMRRIDMQLFDRQLYSVLEANGRFRLVSEEAAAFTQQAMGLDDQDSLHSRTRTIAIGKRVKASHILLISLDDIDVNLPAFTLQIMDVNNGEIILSEVSNDVWNEQ